MNGFRISLRLVFAFLRLSHFLVQGFQPITMVPPIRRIYQYESRYDSKKPFSTNGFKRGRFHSSGKISDDFDGAKELKWNVPRLLHHHSNGDTSVLEHLLVDVYKAAILGCRKSEPSTVTSSFQKEQQPLPDCLAPMSRFIRSSKSDIDNEGHFRVFVDDPLSSTSLPSNLLFSMDFPLSFIQRNLSYQADFSKRGGILSDNSEAVVWCVQKDQDLEYTSRALDSMPLAQLHLGNLPTCEIELDLEILESLEALGVISGGNHFPMRDSKVRCKLLSKDLDVMRSILSFNIDEQKLERAPHLDGQRTLVKLIDSAVQSVRNNFVGNSKEPHLVICAQSTNASMVAAALSAWKQHKLRKNFSDGKQHVEDLLRTAVTVVTFGAVCKKFCNGPAYIHISMHDDQLASNFGVTHISQRGGGEDAVYLHAWSPYIGRQDAIMSLTDHDSHNMNACAIQFLYLVMRMNGVTSFRALYNAARYIDPTAVLDINSRNFAIDYSRHKLGDLLIAPNMDDELLPAMIRATRGDQWLWNQSLNNCDILPDSQEAKAHLEEYFGYSTYEEIIEVLSIKD